LKLLALDGQSRRSSSCSVMLSEKQENGMTTAILIKRYDNRRFYDSAEGRYVSLEQLRDMAADEDVSVVVQDARDGRDITDEIIKKNWH
jgi:polyhydroxyalkanoate synthesis regulator protein